MASSDDETERTVISFDEDEESAPEGPTEVISAEPSPTKRRRIIVDDSDFVEDEDDFDSDEPHQENEEGASVPPAPARPNDPGFFERLGVPTGQLVALVAGVIVGLLLVSLATVYAVTKWTPLLPEPEVGKVGSVGEPGVRGPKGLIGPDGPRGTKGRTGPQGPPGADGPDGIVIVEDVTDGW